MGQLRTTIMRLAAAMTFDAPILSASIPPNGVVTTATAEPMTTASSAWGRSSPPSMLSMKPIENVASVYCMALWPTIDRKPTTICLGKFFRTYFSGIVVSRFFCSASSCAATYSGVSSRRRRM